MEKIFILLAVILAVYFFARFIEYRFLDNEDERSTIREIVRDSIMVSASVLVGGTIFFYFDRYLVGFFNTVMNTETASKVVERENIQIFTDDPGF